MKKAILVVSFGTTYPDTLHRTIEAVEAAIARAFPDWDTFRAFTSEVVIRRLRQRDGVEIDTVAQAMERLAALGYTRVAVQSTHVLRAGEYEKMLSQLEPYRMQVQLSVGEPLLHAEADYLAVADALLSWLPPMEEGEALVLMGHGSDVSDNGEYARLEGILRRKSDRILIGTVEGEPGLETVKHQLAEFPEIRRVLLAPFMVVAGKHVCREMCGTEDSWEEQLKLCGYTVRCDMQGMGECPAIRDLFVEHCRQAIFETRQEETR